MEALDAAIQAIIVLGDSPSVRRLCLDCYTYASSHGEAAGLLLAADLKAGVERYQKYEKKIRGSRFSTLKEGDQ